MQSVWRGLAMAVLVAAALCVPAGAQVPADAPPGTVCITPQGWCPAVKAGPPGAPCACRTDKGWVQGTLNR